jgi:ABC-type phosphate transport system substrate-binding protein
MSMNYTRIAAFFAAAVLATITASAAEIAVVVNKANPESTMDAKSVKSHFLRTLAAWSNGEKVRPVDHGGEPAQRAAFLQKVLGMSAADFERFWLEKQYASADNPPTKAPDDASVLKLVKAFKGAIGFVSKEAAAADADVKVVLTIAY